MTLDIVDDATLYSTKPGEEYFELVLAGAGYTLAKLS